MKTIVSALGKSLFTVIFAISLVAASCNTDNRSKEVKVRDNGKDMKVQEHVNNDSVKIDREKSVNTDRNGDSKTVVKEKKDVDKNNNNTSTPNTNRNR